MGRNSKQRRDARRRRAPQGSGTGSGAGPAPRPASPFHSGPEDDADLVERRIAATLRTLGSRRLEPDQTERAARLARELHPLPASVLVASLRRVVDGIVDACVRGGWCPDDLDVLLRREGIASDRAVLARWLRGDLRDSRAQQPWCEQVERLDPGEAPTGDLAWSAALLHLGALLQAQPGLPPTTTRATRRVVSTPRASAVDADLTRKLATVRGLLAKAESTTFDEEAEALSAKAQELISRYALERLLEEQADGSGAGAPHARRIWLEAPYVGAKAQLVHEVATANTCRAVLSDPPGVTTVVGADSDLEAVELLVTSLLVQAIRAMLRHGRAVDARGATRTRSFRQSFLMAFAVRIGERLGETAEQVLHDSGHERDLLPVLRSRAEAVSEAFEQLVPHTVTRSRSVSNAEGWYAGQAAADLASIDVRARIAEPGERAG